MNWKPPEGQPAGQVPAGWQTTRTDGGGGLSSGAKWLIAIGVVVIVSIPIGLSMDTTSSVDAPRRRSPEAIVRDECPSHRECGIKLDRIGDAYTFVVLPDATDAGFRALGAWAGATGCLEDVDVARIGQTRALDGMVRSANGRSTWTFHPDDGLTVVCSP